jgi:hypothetical protein
MKKLFVIVFLLISINNVRADEVIKARLTKPEEVIKLGKMNPKAMAYRVDNVWVSNGFKFALVYRVQRIDIEYLSGGNKNVTGVDFADPIIIKVPIKMKVDSPDILIKPGDGEKILKFNPITGEETPYLE